MKNKGILTKLIVAIVTVSMAATFSACGKKDDGNSSRKDPQSIVDENKGQSNVENNKTENVSKHTAYPLTITTYDGKGNEITTTYEKAPEKVLAVYQGSIETMLALGLENHLVATAGLDNEVPDNMKTAFSKVNYLDEFTPSVETVTMMEPDMILSWGSLFKEKTLGDASSWIDKGTNIYINTNTRPNSENQKYPKTLENEYEDILNLGKIFDVQDKAEEMVNNIKEVISNTEKAVSSENKNVSTLILESGKENFRNYGADTLAGDMVKSLGGTLAKEDGTDVGKEDLININPEVIFVVYMPYAGDDAEKVKQEKLNKILEDESLKSLDAVKNNRVIPIMLSEMYASASRTHDGVVTFAKGLYPDIQIGN